MWRDKTPSESTRIGFYWDAVVTGGDAQSRETAAQDIDPTLAETISRLERIDDARPARADFSRQFQRQFLEAIGEAPPKPAPTPANGITRFEIDQPAKSKSDLLEFPIARAGRRRLLAAIAAALLLFAGVGGSYYVVERREETQVASDTNVIPAPLDAIDVPMDRGNPERSGVMPGPGVADNLESRWEFEAGRGGISAPAVVGDSIFITSGSELDAGLDNPGSVIAIDALTGSERWRTPVEHATSGTPAVFGEIVYAGDAGGIVYALEAKTGEEIWRQDLQSAWTSAPVVVDDTLFIAAAPFRVPLHVAVQDGTVVVGSGLVGQAADGVQLYAFDRVTGEERWRNTDMHSGQPGLFAFDVESGALKWTFEMPSLETGPAVSGQRVYAGSTLNGALYAIALASGDEIWQSPIGEDLPLNSSPAISGGRVFITTAFGKIICFDESSGEERWRASAMNFSLNSSAIVVDDSLYIVDTNFGVSALSTVDGSVLWSEELDLKGQVVDSPVVLNGSLYIVTSLEAEQGHIARLWAFTGSGDTDRDAGESS